ncbi:hypothetical protein M432DRAFT_638675 [Thermoascus aurantiacus ATCC 26904]
MRMARGDAGGVRKSPKSSYQQWLEHRPTSGERREFLPIDTSVGAGRVQVRLHRGQPRAPRVSDFQKTKGPAGMRKISVFLFRDRNPVSKLGRWTTSRVQHLATENSRLFCRKGDHVHSGRSSGRVRGGPCAGVSRAMIVRSRGWTRMVLTRLRPWTSHCARDAQVPAQGGDLRPFDDSLAGRAGGERAGEEVGRGGRGAGGRAALGQKPLSRRPLPQSVPFQKRRPSLDLLALSTGQLGPAQRSRCGFSSTPTSLRCSGCVLTPDPAMR